MNLGAPFPRFAALVLSALPGPRGLTFFHSFLPARPRLLLAVLEGVKATSHGASLNACHHPGARTVPAYSASGERLRNYSLASIDRCLALKPPSVVCKVNKRTGLICSVQFRPVASSPFRVDVSPHLGQRYSVLERLDDRPWHVWRFTTPARATE